MTSPALHTVLRPFARLVRFIAMDTWIDFPRPLDDPYAVANGGSPRLRVLVVGDTPAVGFGVAAHSLGLTGALARELASRTGRHTEVVTDAHEHLGIREAAEHVLASSPEGFQVIALMFGLGDALALASEKRWRDGLERTLARVRAAVGDEVRIVVIGVPHASWTPRAKSPLLALVQSHARRFDEISREIVALHANVTFAPVMQSFRRTEGRYGDPSTYARLARELVPVLASGLPGRTTSHPASQPAAG